MAVFLGPVLAGGGPLCDAYPSHHTDGLYSYVAADFMANPGSTVIAPERLHIDRWGHSQPPGWAAIYATGLDTGLAYWFGHLDQRVPVGSTIAAGGFIGTVGTGAGSHVHVGVDATTVGVVLDCGQCDYSHPSSRTYCQQLGGVTPGTGPPAQGQHPPEPPVAPGRAGQPGRSPAVTTVAVVFVLAVLLAVLAVVLPLVLAAGRAVG